MSITFVPIADGVTGYAIPNTRFKTTRISVNLILPLTGETVSKNAILPFVLARSCREYPDYTALNARLAYLYGASLSADAVKLGDAQVLRLIIGALDDRFSQNAESIASECASLMQSLLFDPAFQNNTFRTDDIESEKRLFLERINGEINNKRSYAISRCESVLCDGSPYGIPKYGTAENAAALTPSDVFDAWQAALKNAHIRINVIGQSDPKPIFDGFSRRFEGLGRSPLALENTPAAATAPKTVTEKMAVSQGKLVMGFSTGIRESDSQTVAFRVMTDLFGGGPYSKLFLNVREKLSLCYYCAARYNRRKGILLIDSGVEAENCQKAQDEILRQLDLLKAGEFTDSELSASKMSLIDSIGSIADSASGIDSWYSERLFDENPDTPEQYAKKIESITAEQVAEAAKAANLATTYVLMGDGDTK